MKKIPNNNSWKQIKGLLSPEKQNALKKFIKIDKTVEHFKYNNDIKLVLKNKNYLI